jgi:hypothetical protein
VGWEFFGRLLERVYTRYESMAKFYDPVIKILYYLKRAYLGSANLKDCESNKYYLLLFVFSVDT